MKITRTLIVSLLFSAATVFSPIPAAMGQSASAELTSSRDSLPREYQFLTGLLTTFGNNLSSRDAATELNEAPTFLDNQYSSFTSTSSDTGTSTHARVLEVDNSQRLGFLNWLIRDDFNKDRLTVFEKKEWVDAGVPEFGFFEGFTGLMSRAMLQSEGGGGRVNLNAIGTEESTEGEFQF